VVSAVKFGASELMRRDIVISSRAFSFFRIAGELHALKLNPIILLDNRISSRLRAVNLGSQVRALIFGHDYGNASVVVRP